jgi:hypothetical protein
MRTPLLIAAAAAVLGVAACGAKTDSSNNAVAESVIANVANAPPAEMPPPMKSSKTYRCDDNSVLYVDLFQGDTQAAIKVKPTDAPIRVTAPAAGEAMVSADGAWSITPAGAKLNVTAPGKKAQSCAA